MKKRILACLACIGVLLFILDQKEYPFTMNAISIFFGLIMGRVVAWMMVLNIKRRVSLEFLTDKYFEFLDVLEPLIVIIILVCIFSGNMTVMPISLGVLLSYITALPLHEQSLKRDHNTRMKKMDKLSKKQKEYILQHVHQILGRSLESDLYLDLQKFFLENSMYQKRKEYPTTDHIIYEFIEKVTVFWKKHQRIMLRKQRLPSIRNESEISHENAVLKIAVTEFENEYGFKLLSE